MAPRPDDDALSAATLAAMNAFYRAGGKHAVEQSDMPEVINAFRAVVEVVLCSNKATPAAPVTVKKLFSADDAAEVLGIGATTVRLMTTSGRLKYVRVGRGRKISAQEIERFIGESEKFADAER